MDKFQHTEMIKYYSAEKNERIIAIRNKLYRF